MSESNGGDERYWAFISYSHADAAFGRRLHRRLEGYVLPRRVAGKTTAQGTVPRRLTPIFRDRDEFPAATDLSAEVRAALKISRSLIVVCSPTAAKSPWVAREIELFRALHPTRPILAAIREGEPHDSFPEALRHAGPGGAAVEPLAADLRRGHDGWELGVLKLVAGMLGVGLDELVQRDAQRRTRRVTAITASALAAVLMMGALTAYAVSARNEAERQRAEAEGLVEFMLTDLRTKLKGVGRLDVMGAVNERALAYYGDQDIGKLTTESLERRAKLFLAMGEDDVERGNLDRAVKEFREASRTTATLLDASPNDSERIFDHAQSEFWLGTVAYERKDVRGAMRKFTSYRHLAERLVAIAPRNTTYRKEVGYADGNLCAMALEKPVDAQSAIRYCREALAQMEEVAGGMGSSSMIGDLINRHGWLADAYHAANDLNGARSERLTQERMLKAALANDPNNLDLRERWVTTQRALAVLEIQSGQKATARDRLKRDLNSINDMIQRDPTNKRWAKDRERIETAISTLH